MFLQRLVHAAQQGGLKMDTYREPGLYLLVISKSTGVLL